MPTLERISSDAVYIPDADLGDHAGEIAADASLVEGLTDDDAIAFLTDIANRDAAPGVPFGDPCWRPYPSNKGGGAWVLAWINQDGSVSIKQAEPPKPKP